MNTPALTSTPPGSARMGHAHSPVTIWNPDERAQPGPWARRGHRSSEMTDISKEAVERLARTADLFAKAMKAWQHQTQKHNEDVRDTLRALSTRVQELEELLDQMNKAAKEAEAAERWCGRLQGLDEATQAAAKEAERYASHYPEGTDGRNTFTILADSLRGHILEALKEQSND